MTKHQIYMKIYDFWAKFSKYMKYMKYMTCGRPETKELRAFDSLKNKELHLNPITKRFLLKKNVYTQMKVT